MSDPGTITVIRQSLVLAARFDRSGLKRIICLQVVAALTQSLSFISLIPFLYLASNPDIQSDSEIGQWLIRLNNYFAWPESLFWIGGVFIMVIVFVNIFDTYTEYVTEKFLAQLLHALRMNIFSATLNQDYHFLSGVRISSVEKLLHEDLDLYLDELLEPSLKILSEGFNSVFLTLCLLVFAPIVTFAVMSVLLLYFALTNLILTRALMPQSSKIEELFESLYRNSNEALANIRYLHAQGATDFFIQQLDQCSEKISKLGPRVELISIVPRPLFESLMATLVVISVCLLTADGKSVAHLLPFMGAAVFAVYRLMPSVQAIFSNAISIRAYAYATESLAGAINTQSLQQSSIKSIQQPKEFVADSIEPVFTFTHIKLNNISFMHRDSSAPVLENLNLSIRRGEHVGFTGASGAGKSTLLDIIMMLLQPTTGSITKNNLELHYHTGKSWRRNFGYVAQDVILMQSTISNNIAFGLHSTEQDMKLIRKVARQAGISAFIEDTLPELYDTEVGDRGARLSGGQRQRIGIARALYRQPALLLLDEATNALDDATERAIVNNLRSEHPELTILSISHRESSLALCDSVYYLKNGELQLVRTKQP